MNTQLFSDAMGELGEKYIVEAATYKRTKKKNAWMNWGALAACLFLFVMISFPGIINPDNSTEGLQQENGTSSQDVLPFQFVLTAYAKEPDNNLSAAAMQEGENVPVSLFETESGLKGFVFSYDITEPEQLSYISVMTDGEFPGVINEIVGLEMETDKHYIYFIPKQTQNAPYSLMISHLEENTVYEFYISIDEIDDGYTATIESIVSFEAKTAP